MALHCLFGKPWPRERISWESPHRTAPWSPKLRWSVDRHGLSAGGLPWKKVLLIIPDGTRTAPDRHDVPGASCPPGFDNVRVRHPDRPGDAPADAGGRHLPAPGDHGEQRTSRYEKSVSSTTSGTTRRAAILARFPPTRFARCPAGSSRWTCRCRSTGACSTTTR